jgi:DNA polymerase III delta prime subunit
MVDLGNPLFIHAYLLLFGVKPGVGKLLLAANLLGSHFCKQEYYGFCLLGCTTAKKF